jgi:hypothetical protein
MEPISARDREILRKRAQIQLDYANSPQNETILKKWRALAAGRRESPTVRLLFCNFRHEVITSRLQCEGKHARQIEASLLNTLVGRELFDDDTPISPTFDISWQTHVTSTPSSQIWPLKSTSSAADTSGLIVKQPPSVEHCWRSCWGTSCPCAWSCPACPAESPTHSST